jgi:hypothetical protein
MISYGLLDILRERPDQVSFHVASERALRVEFMRFSRDQKLGPLAIEGDVVVTCLEGSFIVGEGQLPATTLTQLVVPQGEVLKIVCDSDQGALQIIWAPPFGVARPT